MTDRRGRDLELFTDVREARGIPVILRDRHLDVVASNPLARALTPGFHEGVNLARFTFVDSAAYQEEQCWEMIATEVAAMLRESLDRTEHDESFRRIVGELSATSARFASEFAREEQPLRAGSAHFQETPVGVLHLRFTEHCVDPGRFAMMVFGPVDAHAAEDLRLLAEFIASDPFPE